MTNAEWAEMARKGRDAAGDLLDRSTVDPANDDQLTNPSSPSNSPGSWPG